MFGLCLRKLSLAVSGCTRSYRLKSCQVPSGICGTDSPSSHFNLTYSTVTTITVDLNQTVSSTFYNDDVGIAGGSSSRFIIGQEPKTGLKHERRNPEGTTKRDYITLMVESTGPTYKSCASKN